MRKIVVKVAKKKSNKSKKLSLSVDFNNYLAGRLLKCSSSASKASNLYRVQWGKNTLHILKPYYYVRILLFRPALSLPLQCSSCPACLRIAQVPLPFSVRSVFVQCSFNACSMLVQCSFNACSMLVQCLFNDPTNRAVENCAHFSRKTGNGQTPISELPNKHLTTNN